MSILVIGGRSKIGSALIGELIGRGVEVRALIRDRDRAAELADEVTVVVGDLAEPDSIAEAMQGVEKVFLLSSAHRDAVAWHTSAIEAAKEAGVELLVRSSILGAGEPSEAEFIDSHVQIDAYLQAS